MIAIIHNAHQRLYSSILVLYTVFKRKEIHTQQQYNKTSNTYINTSQQRGHQTMQV